MHSQRELTSRELAVSEERQRSLLQQQESVQAQQLRLEDDLQAGLELLAGSVQEMEQLSVEQEEARGQLEKTRQALADRQGERDRVEKAIQAARQQVANLNMRQGQLQARLVENQAQSERTQKTLDNCHPKPGQSRAGAPCGSCPDTRPRWKRPGRRTRPKKRAKRRPWRSEAG